MIRNYLKTAYRNLLSNISYTAINVFGLAIGLACCIVIGLYVRFELSFESFQESRHQIYRYIPRSGAKGELAMQTYTPAGLAPFFANSFPEISSWCRYTLNDAAPLFTHDGETLAPENFALMDSSFFNIFSVKLIRGKASQVLERPFTIAISKSIADRFFPGADPIGKQIMYSGKIGFEVTGVFEDMPANSHMQFSYAGSFVSLPGIVEQLYNWRNDQLLTDMGAWNYSSYFVVPDADATDLEKRMSVKLHEFQSKGEPVPANFVYDWLQPMDKIHFTKGIKGDDGGTGNMSYVYIFSSVAAFVLLIACFNFMNLSTALALRRAKEVGLRKTIGATRSQLVVQFMGETVILIVAAFVIGFQLVEIALPRFNDLMDMRLRFNLFDDSLLMAGVLAVGVLTAAMAGGYPAFYLASFRASHVIKGDQALASRSGLRKVLTVAQFGIAAFLIIGTMVVYQQMAYMKDAELGFDKEHVVSFYVTPELHSNFEGFKDRLLSHSGIEAVSLCGNVPGNSLSHWTYSFPDLEGRTLNMNTVVMDYDYLKVMGISMESGRPLSREYITDDSLGYLVNETAVKELNLSNPIGTRIQVEDGMHKPGKIVGVVKDFHFRSLQHKVDPLVMRIEKSNAWVAAIRLAAGNPADKLKFIGAEWSKVSPAFPFDYSFLDESYDKLYKSEERTGILLTTFSFLAIAVACLGLLGLASFLTQQRRREISIRKVHGATVGQVITLLSWDFVKLVLTGFVIVAPLAWYAVDKWLENFAHRVELSPVVFILAAVLILLFAVLTVVYQSYKASLSNPAEVLKEK